MKTFIPFILVYIITSIAAAPRAIKAQSIIYNENEHTFILENPPKPESFPGIENDPQWGIWMWEFGDGHYSMTQQPVHYYQDPGWYEVSVYLTPIYSLQQPFELKDIINVTNASSKRISPPEENDKWVNIKSNAGDYLVVSHEMQFVVHYSASEQIPEGDLLLFFNNEKEKKGLSFDPLIYLDNKERYYYREQMVKDVSPDYLNAFPGDFRDKAIELYNEYNNTIAFKIPKMVAGEERRLFLSIKSDDRLKEHRDKKRKLTIVALFVPSKTMFDKKKHLYTHEMEILKVHDPNKIKPQRNTIYYKKGKRKKLFYRIDFQNTGKDVVYNLSIDVPIKPPLDITTLTINQDSIKPYVEECPFYGSEDSLSCYTYEIIKASQGDTDTLRFNFHNIILKGSQESEKKEETKGAIGYTILTDGVTRSANAAKTGIIYFQGEPKGVKISRNSIKLREKKTFLKGGFLFTQNARNYSSPVNFRGDQLDVGIGYLNAPIGTGFSYGGGVYYTRMNFSGQDTTFLLPPAGGTLFRSEKIDFKHLELRAELGYQISGIVRGFLEGGVIFPIRSSIDLKAETRDQDGNLILQDDQSYSYGIFGNRKEGTIFNQPVDLKQSIGFVGGIGAEIGWLNRASIGVALEYRNFPNSISRCSNFFSANVFLRIGLLTFGGKDEGLDSNKGKNKNTRKKSEEIIFY